MTTTTRMRALGTVCVAAILSGCAGTAGGSFRPASPSVSMNAMSGKYIKHVVIVVQENRTFDDLFSTFPGADGATSGYYLKQTSTGYVKTPINLVMRSLAGDEDVNHDSGAYNVSCDGTDTYPKTSCQMDGFNLEHVDGPNILAGKYPYMYVNPADITPYWSMAQQYGLSDYMFQTQGSGSFTAHLDLVAGTSVIDDSKCGGGGSCALIDYPSNFVDWGCSAPDTTSKSTTTSLLTRKGKYLHYQGPFPCLTFPTMTMRDLLDGAGVSWKYYTPAYSPGSAGALWNAFSAISDVYNDPGEWGTNVSWPETNIFNDITNNTLPAVSWIVPESNNSDHPWGKGGKDNGPSWVTSIVNAIGQSDYWNSTAIIVTWD
ncbi:MAG TPA: alkaline phosphatase family protein, partial [Candidatus Tumulicola sp.]